MVTLIATVFSHFVGCLFILFVFFAVQTKAFEFKQVPFFSFCFYFHYSGRGIEKDIAAVGFCRGMQMLAVVSGAEMIQDIPTHFQNLNKEYLYQHRNEKATPESYRDYAPHDVSVANDSLAYEIYQQDLLTGCPSWHHQAVLNVDDTNLIVSGSVDTNSEKMIEIIEYTGKDFIIGFQFHPEAAVVKHLQGAENADEFMDRETALLVFEALIAMLRQ